MTTRRRVISIWLLMLLPSALWGGVVAVPEYTLKAAYLYNFAQLTEWPAEAEMAESEEFRVCSYGTEGWGDALEGLSGKEVASRSIRVRSVREPGEARQCDLLFIGEGDPRRAAWLIGSVRGMPVLTVSDSPGVDAMLTILTEERRLAFRVNLHSARESKLRLSSKLLNLARHVAGR